MRRLSPLAWFVVLLALTAGFALGLPPSSSVLHTFHITSETYRLAIFTLIVPYAVIWFSAFYGYGKLARYAKAIRGTREGSAFQNIALGTGILAWGLAVPTLLAIILGGVAMRYPAFAPSRTIIDEYVALLAPLIGFWIIGAGTRKLADIAHTRPTRAGILLFGLAMILVTTFFQHAVVGNKYTGGSPYYLPVVLLMTTIITPYVFTWYIGLLAAYELWLYAIKARGVLYKRALSQLAGGIAIVIAGSVTAQYATGSYTTHNPMSLFTLLATIYGLLVVQAAGYILVAAGAHRLKKMEEV